MRILFVTRHFGCLRNYEGAIIELAQRGHQLHLAALQEDILGGRSLVERLAATYPGITVGWTPPRGDDVWVPLTTKVRLAIDYLRYLGPGYAETPRLVRRAEERTPYLMLWLVGLTGRGLAFTRQLHAAVLRRIEQAIPRSPIVDAYLTEHRPDIVLLTPLIGLGSLELDYLVSAKALGIPTVFCVWSWDNLSTKSLVRALPDAVTVWNQTQQQEAVELHGIPAERVVVTGAQCFDHWFDRGPTRTREEFCARVGLPADRPFLLWVCSALFRGSPVEAEFMRLWIEYLRSSADADLRNVAVLVRPHPSRLEEWAGVDLGGLGPVSLWGANPIDSDAKADYYDSLHYSAAVVGLNTSAFLEAAIVGRAVLTLLLPEFWENQEGTLHFHYLLKVNGGLLQTSRSFDEHIAQLVEVLRDPASAAARSRSFTEAFIRPHGLHVSGTGMFVETVERVAARGPGPQQAPVWWVALVRPWLRRIAERANREGRIRHLLMSPRERVQTQRLQARLQQRLKAKDERVRAKEERMHRRREKLERRAEERRRKEQRRAARWREKREARAGIRRQQRRRALQERSKKLERLLMYHLKRLVGAGK